MLIRYGRKYFSRPELACERRRIFGRRFSPPKKRPPEIRLRSQASPEWKQETNEDNPREKEYPSHETQKIQTEGNNKYDKSNRQDYTKTILNHPGSCRN